MADFNNMDELELPDLGSLDSSEPVNYRKSSSDDGIIVGDVDDYDLDSISIASLSEMDGSEINAAEPSAPEKKEKPAVEEMAVPQLEEMYTPQTTAVNTASANTAPAQKPQTGFTSTASSGSSSSYQSVYGQVNSYSSNTSTASSSRSSFYDNMDASSELSIAGEKKAKVLAIIIIVISALDLLLGLLAGFVYIAAAIARIVLAVRFMKGSDRARWALGGLCVLSVINYIRTILGVSEITILFAELGITFVVSIIQFFLIVFTVGLGVMAYFFLFDKSVKEYSERGGWN